MDERADDMRTADRSPDGPWTVEEAIDPQLLRVRCGDRTQWFAVVDSDEVGEHEATVWHDVRGASVDDRAGLLVARCEGGLLEAVLRRREGMPPAQALGVVDEVLDLLEGSPASPQGMSRAAIRSVAVERGGHLTLIPGRFRTGALRTDAAELGELLHLALTGSTWEETGLPLAETAPEVPAATAALVTDLLDGTALAHGTSDRDGIAALRARIARLGPSRDRGFLPAEPGVEEDDAPTGTLSPDVVVALRGGPRVDPAAHEAQAHRLRRRPVASGTTTRRARQRKERGTRRGRVTVGVLVVCAIGITAGASIIGAGAGDADAQHAPPHATTVLPPDPTPTPPGSTEAEDSDSAAAPSEAHSLDPVDAAVELTRARADAFARGDAEALAAVTVPGSPAAQADAERTMGECSGCADALSLSDLGLADDQAEEGDTGAGAAPSGDAAPDEGRRVRVQATMRTAGATPIPVVLVLVWHEDRWRVHDAHPS